MITAVKVSDLSDGDVFSVDGGLTWHVAFVPQFGTVAVWASARRDDDAPTIRVEAGPDQQALRLGVETRSPWILHYRRGIDHHLSLHRERGGAIAHLAAIVRERWGHLTNRQILELYPEPPQHPQKAVNVYFASLEGRVEDYAVQECAVQPTPPTTEPEQEHVEGHVGLDWVCLCGNDPTFEGYSLSTADGELVPDDGRWDGIHYRCLACGRVIEQPTGLVVAHT